jgi:hypothetical protein
MTMVCIVFKDDGETGYLYLSDHGGEGIIDHLHIYDDPEQVGVKEENIAVVWFKSQSKCGVKIWGSFLWDFDLDSNKKISMTVEGRESEPISDPALLAGF